MLLKTKNVSGNPEKKDYNTVRPDDGWFLNKIGEAAKADETGEMGSDFGEKQ